MADPFGISFSPADQSGPNGQPTNGQRPTPVQQAIQTLSLRIPRVVGAGSIAPPQLLNGAGGSGLGDPNSAAILEQLKRLLFGNPASPSSPMAPPPASAPGGNPLGTLGDMFGSPGGPVSQPPDSGSGAPLPGGSGEPLPPARVPSPRFDPGKDFKGLPQFDNPQPTNPMPSPMDRPGRGGRGV